MGTVDRTQMGEKALPRKTLRTIEVDRADEQKVAAYKRGAIAYVRNLPDWAREELYRKPFCTFSRDVEAVSLVYLHDLANILELLSLPSGASILDVACGPGWLSEALYRFGYRVTGVDIAEDLLSIARERIRALPSPPIQRDSSWIDFRILDIETQTLARKFDAVLLYDCLHHFVDAEAALSNLRTMMSPRGILVIKEGAMPAPGSKAERELLQESETFTTLEAPFDPATLEELLRAVGFADVRRYAPQASIVPAQESAWRRIRRALGKPPGPPVNFFLGRPVPLTALGSEVGAPRWRAELSLLSVRMVADGAKIRVRVLNAGRTVWTAGDDDSPGTFCLGCRLFSPAGEKLDEFRGRTPLPEDVSPGESAEVEVEYPLSATDGAGGALMIDVLCRGIFWFGDHDSPPLVVELPGRR